MNKKIKHPSPALVLGLGVNGLSVVRSLGRRGISVTALECKKPSGTPYSRYIKKLICLGPEPPKDRVLETMLRIGKQHGAPMFLLPTNDFFVLFVAEHRKELSRYFSFTVVDYKLLESVTNKRLLHQILEKHNIPRPETFFLEREEQLNSILAKVKYPCFLKPVYSHIFRRKFKDVKVLKVENEAELLSCWKEVRALNIEVMIQELIPGGDEMLFEVGAFCDNSSRPLAVCSARKIRQLPIGAGDGSARVSVENRFLEDAVMRLLEAIGYVGPCEAEFKWDFRDKQYKLLEINPRTVLGQELYSRCGVDIPYMTYEYTMNKKVVSPGRYKVGLKWICFEWDFSAFRQAHRMKGLTLSQWFKSIKDARVFAFFAWDDPLPCFVQTAVFLRRLALSAVKTTTRKYTYQCGTPIQDPCANVHRMTEMENKPYAVVLGFSVNSLSVARSLGRRGIFVVAMDRVRNLSMTGSRYVRRRCLFGENATEGDLVESLIRFGRQQRQPIFLFPTNDFYVLLVSRHRKVLSEYYTFTMADEDVLETVVNKQLLYEAAERAGVSYPRSLTVRSKEELDSKMDQIRYPCFIKPVYSHIWRKKYRNVKVLEPTNQQELLTYMREILDLNIEVLIQEIIPGGDDAISSVVAYMDRQHQPIAICSKRKLRQYPVFTGNGCLQISTRQPELEKLGLKFLQAIRYVGPACAVEFKWDERDRQYKLIEINARTEVGQELMTRAGVDIPYIAYMYTMHGKRLDSYTYRTGLKWICFEWDFFSFLEGRQMKILSTAGWLKSLWGVNSFAFFCWDDPVPFFVQTGKFLGKVLQGGFRRILNWIRLGVFQGAVDYGGQEARIDISGSVKR